MDLEKCLSLEDFDLFNGEVISSVKLPCDDMSDTVYQSQDILKSLREVNNDDTLTRVLSSDVPDARAADSGENLDFPVDNLVPLNEEVTLCAASSHVDSVMSECISDGIEANDIGSLLEQYLEYEKAISPVLSPVTSTFPTPVPSPGNEIELVEECIMTDIKGHPLIFKDEEPKAHIPTPPVTPVVLKDNKSNPSVEILASDMIVDNQVIISTSEEEETTSDLRMEKEAPSVQTDIDFAQLNKKENKNGEDSNAATEYKVRNENGIVIVEIVKQNSDATKQDKKAIEENDNPNEKPKLKSVIKKAYQIPKRQRDSKMRTRSRSPLRSQSSKSKSSQISSRNANIESKSWSSDSDEDGVKERFDCFKSERRTPVRKDDKRKRRKYSSCSDDEYDYYRYSRRKNSQYCNVTRREPSPLRKNYEHDYNLTYKSKDDRYHRSNSLRENHSHSYSCYREKRSHKSEVYKDADDENVHERMTELATPVPYDIEHERKIGFLCQGPKSKGSLERRNVYAGGIRRNVTKSDLIRRFEIFGPIEKVSLHFRDRGDNYAFIIFESSKDAMRAVEDGNKDPNYDKLDLCFGGRRNFVGGSYVDFDANISYLEENDLATPYPSSPPYESDFDALLAMARKQQTV